MVIQGIFNKRLVTLIMLMIVPAWMVSARSSASDQLSIQTLIIQAASYELHEVTLQGVTSAMQIAPPIQSFNRKGVCPFIYGRATFILDDGTASIPVDVLGSCAPEAVAALPEDKDVVRVSAVILVNRDKLPVRVRAQATDIRILDLK